MKKPKKVSPTKERIVQEAHLRATQGGSGYTSSGGREGDPPPDPNGGS
jgi:hypothetical protein